MKKLISLFAVLFVMLMFTSSASAQSKFKDVNLYETNINYLVKLNVIHGYKDGTFKPNNNVTRLQAAQMILNAKGININNVNVPDPNLSDVKKGDYGYNYIAEVISLGYIQPHGTRFDPYVAITRGEMAYSIAKAFNLKGQTTKQFSDVPSGFFAHDAIYDLAANNITVGYPDGSFKPNKTLTRAHFAVFLSKAMNKNFRSPQGNTGDNSTTNASDNNSDQELTVQQNINLNNDKVVEIHDNLVQGSGVVVGNGLILTNHHVISDMDLSQAVVVLNNGKKASIVGVVADDSENDLALLKTSPINITPVSIGDTSKISLGDNIITIGSPDGLQNSISIGIVSGFRTIHNTPAIQFSATIDHGSSGGGLFNSKGQLIGITSNGMSNNSNLNFAINIKEALNWSKFFTMSYSDLPVIQNSNTQNSNTPNNTQNSNTQNTNTSQVGFGGIYLGMTKDQVTQLINNSGYKVSKETSDTLYVVDAVFNQSSVSAYTFDSNNKLTEIVVVFTGIDNYLLQNLQQLYLLNKKELTSQFGNPNMSKDVWGTDYQLHSHWDLTDKHTIDLLVSVNTVTLEKTVGFVIL